MKGTNYLQMMEEAKTSAEALDIIVKVNEIIPKVEAPINNEYSDWTDNELSEYLDMLYKVDPYYYEEHFEEFHTPRELQELDELVR